MVQNLIYPTRNKRRLAMLFEVAIIEAPTPAEVERGESEKLVFGPKAVIAGDEKGAAIVAVMGEGDSLTDVNQTRMVVLVRPFA